MAFGVKSHRGAPLSSLLDQGHQSSGAAIRCNDLGVLSAEAAEAASEGSTSWPVVAKTLAKTDAEVKVNIYSNTLQT